MSQQVPFDNNSDVPHKNDMMTANYVLPESTGQPQRSGEAGGGSLPPMQGPQIYTRNKASMIDPIESAKITPQILILLILSGLRRHWKWSIPMGLVLGLLAAGVFYLLNPIQYGAQAAVHIRSVVPRIITEDIQQARYNEYVNTQIALIKNPIVIGAAVETADVAKLPTILKQKNNKQDWLQKRLKVEISGKSEILLISIETDDAVASEKIVNAVLDSYIDYLTNTNRDADQRLLGDLQSEKTRQTNTAKTLQASIRGKTVQAALKGASAGNSGMSVGLGQGESLKRDAALEDARLTALKATRIASIDRIENPRQVPLSLLIQIDPELAELNNRKELILSQRETMAEKLKSPSEDPRIQQFDRQIKELDNRISSIVGDTDGRKREEIINRFRSQEELRLYLIDQEIREKEILVDTLQKKYNDQLDTSASRAGDILDVSFDEAQLERANKVLGVIEDRIISTRSDRAAPAQILPLSRAVLGSPSWKKQLIIVGGGTMVFAFFPLLLSIAVERFKPRLYHVSQVRRSVPHVLIGEIMEPPVSWIHGATFRKRLARYRESVHNWCTHLLLSDPFRSCRTLSVASVAGDDGKTFLAVQIAAAMAQMKAGNVLLIDGDMRVGRLHLLFGNEEAGIGLADVLSFRNGFGEAMVQNEREPNLHLLSAGQLDVTPYELLGDGRFRELLDMLEQNYALILVVLPPVSNAAESLIMASSTDSTLLCVRQGETVLAAMEDVYRKLVNTGASVDGIVVKDIPYYQMAGKDGGFTDKLEQIRLSHLLQYTD